MKKNESYHTHIIKVAIELEILILALLSVLLLFYGGYSAFGLIYGSNARYRVKKKYLPRVSFIIPTFNEEDIIERKIENTRNLDYPKDRLEITFVDSSVDKTREVIKKFKEQSSLSINLLEEDRRRGLASALNLAYSRASGEIVIKTDCDMLLENDFITKIVKYFSDPIIGAVSGAVRVLNQLDVEVGYRTVFEKLRLAESNLDSTYIFNGFAFRRNLVEPIDEKSVADDAELALKIRKKGYRTVYAPDAIFHEVSPASIKTRIQQKSRRAQGHIRLIYQNSDLLFNPKYGKFGLFIFPANFFMIIVSPWLMLITLLSICVWLHTILNILSFPVIFALISGVLIMYTKSSPKIVAGFIDAQINLLVGFLKLITRGPEFSWASPRAKEKISVARA